jgi:serine/threonine-protein kinase
VIGRVLAGRYELDEIVGQGGMATVYRAHDQALGRDVALKVLRDQYAADPEFVERFDREARGAARLAHPNVVDIYDVGSDDGMRYLVMELVEGENLKRLIRRSAPLPPALVIRLGREIAAALDYAHRRGLIHRDVKPQNVLIDAEGHAKLTDFGIVEAAGSAALTETGTVLGTAQYMAPEQARGRSVGPPSDIYSLGVVLYEMATGRLPFEGETPLAIALRHVQDEPTPPRRLNPSLPPALEAAILRAMAKDPARRYPSAAALAEELEGGPDPIRQRTTRMASVDGDRSPAASARRAPRSLRSG